MPRGGAFELVSCPHYLAEIVIYAGLALVAGRGQLLPWLVVTWVVRPALGTTSQQVLNCMTACMCTLTHEMLRRPALLADSCTSTQL